MDMREKFSSAWKTRFPSDRDNVPELLCFSRSGEHDGRINQAKLQETLQNCRKRISDLKQELAGQEFIAGFLTELLQSLPYRSSSISNQHRKLPVVRPEIRGKMEGETAAVDLDMQIPVLGDDEQSPVQYQNLDSQVTGCRLSRSQSRPTGSTEEVAIIQNVTVGGHSDRNSIKAKWDPVASNVSTFVGLASPPGNNCTSSAQNSHSYAGSPGQAQGKPLLQRQSPASLPRRFGFRRENSTDSSKSDFIPPKPMLEKTFSDPGHSPIESTDRKPKLSRAPVPTPRPKPTVSVMDPVPAQPRKNSAGKTVLVQQTAFGRNSPELVAVAAEDSDTCSSIGSLADDQRNVTNILEHDKSGGDRAEMEKPVGKNSQTQGQKGPQPYVNINLDETRKLACMSKDIKDLTEKDAPNQNQHLTSPNSAEDEDEDDDDDIEPYLTTFELKQINTHIKDKASGETNETSVPGRPACKYPMKPRVAPKTYRASTHSQGAPEGEKIPPRSSKSRESNSSESSVHFYDNATTMNKENEEEEEEDTSSDDEPIYYNILLMKQHHLNRVSIDADVIYASVDLQKKELERRARIQETDLDVVEEEKTNSISVTTHPQLGFTQNEDEPPTPPGSTGPSASRDSVFLPDPDHKDKHAQHVGTKSSNKEEERVEWKKRQSMFFATEDVDSSNSKSDYPVTTRAEMEKLQMRKWVVTSILDSEHAYVNSLDVLLHYMKSLQAAAQTSQPVLTNEDIDVIFFNIKKLHEIHNTFVRELEPKVERWTSDQQIGETFKVLALSELPVSGEYLKNYQKAVATLQRCSQENEQFYELTKEIKCKGVNETLSLEELLHKPVVRVQRNTLVLHDLIKCTPTTHPDYDMLQKALTLTQHFLTNFQTRMDTNSADNNQRYLVKNSLIVEKVGNNRKLRHVFLFNDVLVCTKQKISGRQQKFSFDTKWFIPLSDLNLETKSDVTEEKKIAESRKTEIESLQRRVSVLQSDLRNEIRKNKMAAENQRNWSFRGHTRNIEKIKKKLADQESALVLALPHLVFKFQDAKLKTYTLLMSSDYERNEWRDTIKAMQSKLQGPSSVSAMDINLLVDSCKELPRINQLGNLLMKDDFGVEEETLSGALNVTIHTLNGLKSPCDTFCCLEVDSFGHYYVKAKTNVIVKSSEPSWNQDFEIDLDGAQTLRILCYKMGPESDLLLGKSALELSKAWLRGDFQEKTISLNEEISVTVSLRYISRDQTLKRTPSKAKTGLFGVKIHHVTQREGGRIPLIVTSCLEEVEKRGMTEVGIYRVSGVSSEIQRLKKAFERNSKGGAALVHEVDINVVTGLVKLYFRELPQPLFTEEKYHHFIEGMGLADQEARDKCIISLIRSLPEPNHSTVVFIIDHIIKVSKNEAQNKMTIQNLATVFGPTLLRPALKDCDLSPIDLLSMTTQEAMMQTALLTYFLHLRSRGCRFEK